MMPVSSTVGLRDAQKKLLKAMLNFNVSPHDDNPDSSSLSAWKVLILDAAGQSILSPILKVNELRESGVTLYLQLMGDRQPITDVPAIYFVEPSAEAVERIGRDLGRKLYEQVYINWTSSIPRPLLEELAQQVAQSDSSQLISKVYDQYLNFECLEKNLFTFSSFKETYRLLNSASTNDKEIETIIDQLASSLLSVMLTMGGQSPMICASKGTAAEMLGQRLEKRLRSHMTNMQSNQLGPSNLDDSSSLQRPLLVVLDRNFDLCTPLKHVSTYNALVHDILGMRLNRINVTVNKTKEGVKTFDIDSGDSFWQENAQLPFPSVAENVDSALNKYKTDMQQITRSSGVSNLDDLKNHDLGSTLTAEELKIAINVLPELTERKRLIDMHLQMATALLDQIRERDLGNLFMLEHQLQDLTKATLLSLIRKKEQAGNSADKMRLFLVYLFSNTTDISPNDMAEFEAALREAGCEMTALEAAKKIRSHHKMTQMTATSLVTSPKSSPSNNTPSSSDYFSSLSSRIQSTTTGVLGNLVSSVKNLLPESTETPITKQLDLALELASGIPASSSAASNIFRGATGTSALARGEDQFSLIDPRNRQNSSPPSQQQQQQRAVYTHIIVFIVGGSNYSEYNHVEGWAKKKGQQIQLPIQITFGSTEMITGADFLSQLSRL